jgi:quercetin dioxygenase-like cupin family protein
MHPLPADLLALGKISHPHCDVTFAAREHQQSPPHTHDTTNHVLVVQGCLYLQMDGQERAVPAGQWCTIPAGTEHAERFVEPSQVIVFWRRPVEPAT